MHRPPFVAHKTIRVGRGVRRAFQCLASAVVCRRIAAISEPTVCRCCRTACAKGEALQAAATGSTCDCAHAAVADPSVLFRGSIKGGIPQPLLP